MGLFNRIASKVRQTISSLEKSFRRSSPPASSQNTFSASSSDIDKAASRLEALSRAMRPDEIPREINRELAREAKENIREALEPISRTGNAKRSIQERENPDGSFSVITDGSAPYLESIEDGDIDSGIPPVQNLLKWMKKKQEFASLSDNQRRRVAYAIQTSFRQKRNINKTGRSDVVNLPPRGERRYEFTKETLRRMESDITGINDAFLNGLD